MCIRDRLEKLIKTTKMIHDQIEADDEFATYHNCFFYGPKGSGKELVARQLAQHAGMDFVELKMSSFSKYKEQEADVAFADFFKNVVLNSSKGTVLFVNNAKNVLQDTSKMSRKAENAVFSRSVTAFLAQIAEPSNKCMVIFSASTTEKPAFSEAAVGMIQDVIEFTLPGKGERSKLIEVMRDSIFSDVSAECADSVKECFSESKINEMAQKLDGLSSADVCTVVKRIKEEALLADDEKVTIKAIDKVVQEIVQNKKA